MEYAELKELVLVGEYTEKEIKELRTICDIRLGNYSSRASNIQDINKSSSETYTILFHAQLSSALGRHGVNILGYAKLKSIFPRSGQDIKKVANFLFGIAEEWNDDKKRSKIFVVGVFHLYCELIIGYLKEHRVPISLKTCLQHTDKFVGLVGDAFPGYIESGVIKLAVVRSR